MPTAVLVRGGARLFWFEPGTGVRRAMRIAPTDDAAAELLASRFPDGLSPPLKRALLDQPTRSTLDPRLSAALRREGFSPEAAPLALRRAARESIPPADLAEEKAVTIGVARRALLAALSSPEEVLISLAREEERVERALRREVGASEEFLVAPGSQLVGFLAEWAGVRDRYSEHHARLLETLERTAREVVPNLSEVVGPRTAARLVARGPGLAALARMSSSRLQLLGSRRRPTAGRGPRYGLLYRGARLPEVPADRAAAYARSLAALAVIASRADWATHRKIGGALAARRDRRVESLRRRRST